MAPSETRRNGGRPQRLQLDNVVSSHSELGPAPPDGGYGWIVLVGVILLRMILPSLLLVSYGIFIMMANESDEPIEALPSNKKLVWNGVSLWIPIIFSAIWSLTDPWSRTMAAVVNIKFTTISGVILTVLGLLATKFVVKLEDPTRFALSCLTAGIMTGIGVSLATTPADHLLTRYFRLRLALAQSLVRVGQALGFCVMPFATCILVLQYGYANTLLILAAIAFQGISGAMFFQKPVYQQPQQRGMAYTLLQNEDEISSVGKYEPELETQTVGSHQNDELSVNQHPFYDSVPRPLFSDAELAASGHDVAFFIEDPQDEDVILYVYGDHLRRGVKLSEELKMLYRPIFYVALLLVTAVRITNITFWLLVPSLARSRLPHLKLCEVAGLLSALGAVDVIVACMGHWLVSMKLIEKTRMTCIACFLAAGGLYALSYDRKFVWLMSASALLRLGVSSADILCKPLLKETLGPVEFRLAHSLLDVLSGLLLLLYKLKLGQEDYGFSFWILSWIQITLGTVWGLQPLVSSFCSKRHGHRNSFS